MDLALSPIKQNECSRQVGNLEHGCHTYDALSMVLEGYISDEEDEEKQPLSIVSGTRGRGTSSSNRLKDFYYNEMECEFDGCQELAEYHCADGTSHK